MRRALAAVSVLALLLPAATTAAAPTTAAVSVSARATPAAPLFGDTFAYVVRATVPAASAAGARVTDDVGPFTRLAPASVTRSVSNGVATITVTETLGCLTAGCLPARTGNAVALPAATVTADGRSVAAEPVAVRVGSRVTAAEVQARAPGFTHPKSLPAPTTRIAPGLAAVLLALAGVALVALGLVLIVGPLRRKRSRALAGAAVDPVERAARLLRESAGRGTSDRRRAASLASRVAGEKELAEAAATVAWSRPEPAPPDATTLADRLERTAGRPA